jgi:AhpD family alkylhydroperoxidase
MQGWFRHGPAILPLVIRTASALRRESMSACPSESHLQSIIKEVVMRMLDWNGYRQQVLSGVGALGKLSPDTVKGYVTLGGAGQKTGRLDAKTRELIALAVAISLRCDGCITVHTEAARKTGATKEEIAEALGVAVSVNAGAALVYSTRTLDAFDAASNA